MMIIIALAAALLPAILLWLYIWKKDPQKEPTSWLVKAVLWGVAAVFLVTPFELGIQFLLFGEDGGPSNLFGTTLDAFLVAALPEESVKLLVLWLVLRKNPYFDEHYDGIVYAVSVGLGFAALENVFYVIGDEDWMLVAISRALLAVPGHYAFAVLMGYFYSVYHFVDRSSKVRYSILFVPVLAHGIYDSLVMSFQLSPYIVLISLPVLIWFCVKLQKEAKKKVVAMIEKDSEGGVA